MGPYLLFFFSKHNFFILFFFFRKSIRDSTKEIVQKMKFKVKFAIALIAFATILKNSQGCCHTVSRCFGTPSRHQPNSYARTLLISSWDKLKKKKKKNRFRVEVCMGHKTAIRRYEPEKPLQQKR